nr:hypothetical protein [Allomuricauda sp.]
MKNLKSVGLVCLMIFAVSCDDSDDSNGASAPVSFSGTDVVALTDSTQNGSWRITQFLDDGTDETNDFEGYVFTFNSDGSVVANNGGNSVNGTWSIEMDDDDDDRDEIEFEISFSGSSEFDDLSDDWDVMEYTSSRIRLSEDDDDDDDDREVLVFERVN